MNEKACQTCSICFLSPSPSSKKKKKHKVNKGEILRAENTISCTVFLRHETVLKMAHLEVFLMAVLTLWPN